VRSSSPGDARRARRRHMVEDLLVPAAAQRLRDGAFGTHLDAFCERLKTLGYRVPTIQHKLWVVTELMRWMAAERVVVADLDERFGRGGVRPDTLSSADVRAFLLARVRHMAPRRGQYMASALRSFLRFLFLHGEIRTDLALTIPTVRQWRLSSVPRHLPARDV